jgi:hypothetical protein
VISWHGCREIAVLILTIYFLVPFLDSVFSAPLVKQETRRVEKVMRVFRRDTACLGQLISGSGTDSQLKRINQFGGKSLRISFLLDRVCCGTTTLLFLRFSVVG